MKKLLLLFVSGFLLFGCQQINTQNFEGILVDDNQANLVFLSPENGSEDVSGFTPVTFLWDDPIFTLQNPEVTQQFLSHNITITPQIEGSWQMLGTTGVLFEPQVPWRGSTQYSFRLSDDLIKGPNLFEYSFTTPRIELQNISTDDLIGREPVTVYFDQELLLSEAGRIETKPDLQFQAQYRTYTETDEDGNEETKTDTKAFTLTPLDDWPIDTGIELVVPAGFRSGEGELLTQEEQTQTFRTLGPLSVDMSTPQEVFDGINFSFSAPVSIDSFFEQVTVSSPDADLPDDYLSAQREQMEEYGYETERRYFWLDHPGDHWVPDTEFFITVSGDLTDVYERSLGTDQTKSFRTVFPDTLQPVFFPRQDRVFRWGTVPQFSLWYSGTVESPSLTMQRIIPTGESYSHSFDWSPSPTQRTVVDLDLLSYFPDFFDVDGRLASGLYRLQLDWKTGNRNWDQNIQSYFSVVDFPVEMKQYAGETGALVTPLSFPGEELLPDGGRVITYRQNWDRGRYYELLNSYEMEGESLEISEHFDAALVRKGDRFGIVTSEYSEGMNPYDAPVSYDPYMYTQDKTSTVFFDRPLFRSGDTVYFKSIFRNRRFFEPAFPLASVDPNQSQSYRVRISDPEWEEIYNETFETTGGSLDGAWEIPTTASLGQYQFDIEFLDDGQDYGPRAHGSFYVTEYRKPDFLISSSFADERIVWQDQTVATISAQYAFGGALAGKDVDYTVSLFGYEKCDDWCWFHRNKRDHVLVSGQSVLNSEGILEVPLDVGVDLDEDVDWDLLNLDVTVHASTESPSSQTVSIPFFLANRQVSLDLGPYFYQSGDSEISFSGIVTDLDDESLDNEDLVAELYQTKWVRSDRKDSNGDFVGEWDKTEILIDDVDIETDDKGRFEGMFSVPEEAGNYFVRVSSEDKKDRVAIAEHHFWVWTNNQSQFTMRQNDKDRLLPLYTDVDEYRVGDRVEILFPHNQWPIARVHATIERGKVLETLEANLENNTVSFVVEEWMTPNVLVSVLIEGMNDKNQPEVRWGVVNVPVQNPDYELDIELQTDKETYKPQESIQLTIDTSVNGDSTAGEVTVAVVDETLLALRSRPDLELWKTFLSELPLGVRTTHSLANFLSDSELEDIYDEVESIKAAAESAFGGGGGGKGDDFKPRGDFRDTAAFLASVQTDENGQAVVDIPLPDNLTTWHIWAVGATNDNAFGEAETNVQTTLPLLISPITPNFFRAGDETHIGLLIRRNIQDPEEEDITVTLEAPEWLEFKDLKKEISVSDEARVFFPVSVPFDRDIPIDGMDIEFQINVESESGLRDSVLITRTLFPPKISVSAAEFLSVHNPVDMTFATDERSLRSTLNVKTFGTLIDRLEKFVDISEEANYQCAEQDFTYWTARILYTSLLYDAGIETDGLETDDIQKTLDEILKAQDESGGFQFWTTSREPSVWFTAHVLDFAPVWNAIGVRFPTESLTRAQKWLRKEVETMCDESEETWCLDDTTRQYGVYVLARDGVLSNLSVDAYMNYTDSTESKAWLLRTLALFDEDELSSKAQAQKESLITDLTRLLRVRDRYAFWEESDQVFYSQNERLTAILFEWAFENDFLTASHEDMVRYLTDTQSLLSGNSALRILKALETYSNDFSAQNFPADVLVSSDERELLKGTLAESVSKLEISENIDSGKTETLTISSPNEKQFFTDVELHETFAARDLQPVQKGFWIERALYELLDTDFENPVETLQSGESYVARIKVVTSSAHRQVLVEDSIPTGAEGVNFDLENEDQRLQSALETDEPVLYRGWMRPFVVHQEFYYDKIRMFVPHLSAGTHEFKYIIRARIEGEYEHLPVKIHEMYYPEVFATGKGHTIKIHKNQ
jgi:uncharacterized protein YfaS (alpha-2-macroglobulin family)